MIVKVLVTHFLDYPLGLRINWNIAFSAKKCDQNSILNEDYIFFTYVWGFRELGQML